MFDSTPTTYLLNPNFEGADYKNFNFAVKSSKNKMGIESGN